MDLGLIVTILCEAGRLDRIRDPLRIKLTKLLDDAKDEYGLAIINEILYSNVMPCTELKIEFEKILANYIKEDEIDKIFIDKTDIDKYMSGLEISTKSEKDSAEKGYKLIDLSDCYIFNNQYDKAIQELNNAKAIFHKYKYVEMEGFVHVKMGNIYNIGNNDKLAMECYGDALDILKNLKNQGNRAYWMAAINNNVGNILFRNGNADHAKIKFNDAINLESIEIESSSVDFSSLSLLKCEALLNLGNIYRNEEKFEEAIAKYNESIDNTKNICNGITPLIIRKMAMIGIANSYLKMKDPKKLLKAATYYARCYLDMKKLKYNKGMCIAMMNIGTVNYIKHNFKQALRCYENSLEKNKIIGDNLIECTIQMNIGNIFRSQNKGKEAIEKYNKALALYRTFETSSRLQLADLEFGGENKFITKMPLLKSELLGNFAGIYLDEGMFKEAIECYRDALEVLEKNHINSNFNYILKMRLGLALFNRKEKNDVINAFKLWEESARNLAHEDVYKNEYDLVTKWLSEAGIISN